MNTYDMFSNAVAATPITSQQLLDSYTRELILLCGKDSVGKSCALVSMAAFVQMITPDATYHVIDTEHKFGSALKSFRPDVPTNLNFYSVDNMNQATAAMRAIIKQHKPGDWLAVESMARLWEHTQDLAYEAVAGVSKVDYIEAKLNTEFNGKDGGKVVKKNSPIPAPDDFWPIAKGAHDSGFINPMVSALDLNCILTTTVKKPPTDRGDGSRSFDNKDRKILRAELGIDLNIGGAPSLPYYFETMCLMDFVQGKVTCRVLRDNLSQHDNTRPTFAVPDRKAFAMTFMAECR